MKKENFDVKLGGNIGKPVLNLKIKKNTIVIIETSSFQLALSKFIKPNCAAILNISPDHLDWHKNFKNYKNSKFKIFKLQDKSNCAFLTDKNLIKYYKKNKFKGKIIKSLFKKYKKIKSQIKNNYLNLKINEQNVDFAYTISKYFNVKNKTIIDSLNSFKGLKHRYEIFLNRKKISFINDSKATSFDSTKHALRGNKNIYWILGGLPKKNDQLNIKKLKNNIIKAYIIGKHTSFFKKQINKSINFSISINMKKAVKEALQDISEKNLDHSVLLLSPASASYDQYKNFIERGEEFKKLIRFYAKNL